MWRTLADSLFFPVTTTLTFPAIIPDADRGSFAHSVPDGTYIQIQSAVSAFGLVRVLLSCLKARHNQQPKRPANNHPSGILLLSLSNLRLGMIQEPRKLLLPDRQEVIIAGEEYRINTIANWNLGKDQRVLLAGSALKDLNANDPHFTRHKDLEMVDLVLDLPPLDESTDDDDDDGAAPVAELDLLENGTFDAMWDEIDNMVNKIFPGTDKFSEKLRSNIGAAPSAASSPRRAQTIPGPITRQLIPAILPTGIGSHPPGGSGMDIDVLAIPAGQLPLKNIYYLDDTLCQHRLPAHITRRFQILVVLRGGCSFGEKLEHIPAFVSGKDSLQLVVVVSNFSKDSGDGSHKNEEGLVRPLLDHVQKTPNGLVRPHPIAMCMVDGSHIPTVRYGVNVAAEGSREFPQEDAASLLKRVASVTGRFDASGKIQEVSRSSSSSSRKSGGVGAGADMGQGMAVKRRYWFESMGVPIGNLLMA